MFPVVIRALAVVAVFAAAACASPQAAQTRVDTSAVPTQIDRTLVLGVGRGPESLGSKPLRQVGGPASPTTSLRSFNAGLALNDGHDVPGPYLAESLPQLNTDTWRVLPDGRMETTYRLRPDLTWHDGAPLTADDFVFSARIYKTPELGHAATAPMSSIEEVVAPDPGTVLIRWRQAFADADDLQASNFPPLPRHILETPFAQTNADGFVALPFWLTEYVGAGPFRLNRYELGSYVEGDAFDGHALGRPRIEHIRILFMTDPNTALANLLAGAAHVATDFALQTQQAVVLDREWQASGIGQVHFAATSIRTANIQLRPQFANPKSLLDLRVRKALAHSTDRQTLADALTEGKGAAGRDSRHARGRVLRSG